MEEIVDSCKAKNLQIDEILLFYYMLDTPSYPQFTWCSTNGLACWFLGLVVVWIPKGSPKMKGMKGFLGVSLESQTYLGGIIKVPIWGDQTLQM